MIFNHLTGIVQISWVIILFATSRQVQANGQQVPPAASTQNHIVNPNIKWTVPDLPPQHYQFWLKNHPLTYEEFKRVCSQVQPSNLTVANEFSKLNVNLKFEDPRYLGDVNYGSQLLLRICSKIDDIPKSCWGYESNCHLIYLMPECYGSSLGQAKNEQEHKIMWFNQADFGYVLEKRKELNRLCLPDKRSNHSIKSSFECTKNLASCRGENLMIDFDSILRKGNTVMSKEFVRKGHIGGWNCDLQEKRIAEEASASQSDFLQSWYNELKGYSLIYDSPDKACDETIDKQAFLIKLDSPANIYHYLCSFFNLYATMHLNNRFFHDNQIIIWDDLPPADNQNILQRYDLLWNAFTGNRPKNLREFQGKRVCFKKFVFVLPPRMIGGLYYNTPLVPGCSKSGLFDAFNKHLLHKLKIFQNFDFEKFRKLNPDLIRVTFVSRSTRHRRVTNQDDIITKLKSIKNLDVSKVDFAENSFFTTLFFAQNTDILMGVHGAGLTNTLFLPDWAALFELYDCKDTAYSDLARLRGVRYFTMPEDGKSITKVPTSNSSEPQKGASIEDKFSDYRIDVDSIINVLNKAVEQVRKNRYNYYSDLNEGQQSHVHEPRSSEPKAKREEL